MIPTRGDRHRRRRLLAAAGLGLAGAVAGVARTLAEPASSPAAAPPAAPPAPPVTDGGAVAAPVRPQVPATGTGWRLVQDWDFRRRIRTPGDLHRAFHTRYLYDEGRLDHLNDEWSRYRDDGNHVFGPEGLSLVARAPSGHLAPGTITSGMLRSRWSGRHGVFEARLRMPRGPGLWPAFWLNPQDGGWPPEIDIVEVVNDTPAGTTRSFHFLHGRGQAGRRVHASRLDAWHAYTPGSDYADRFHVFAVEWSADRVRHYVDDVLVADREFAWVHDDGRDAGDAHVLVNLAVGGRWPGPPAPHALPAELVIDYIRVWQR